MAGKETESGFPVPKGKCQTRCTSRRLQVRLQRSAPEEKRCGFESLMGVDGLRFPTVDHTDSELERTVVESLTMRLQMHRTREQLTHFKIKEEFSKLNRRRHVTHSVMVLIVRLPENGPPVVKIVCEALGWRVWEEGQDAEHHFNLWWRTARFTKTQIESCNPYQRLNHFPRTIEITRKDLLNRNIKKMKGIHGSIADFVPDAYILPKDYCKFVRTFADSELAGEKRLWIAKPHDLSRGRKIFVFSDLSELQYDQQYIIQRYIERPLLIDGFKFDLRVYVLVTSFKPLTAYLYKTGLARFSTEKYSLDSKDKFVHLTNASINKFNPKAEDGYKWTFAELYEYFESKNVCDVPALWDRIRSLLIMTLLSIVDEVPKAAPCFELFGFDVILDEQLKPWLLEVNFSPSLNLDTETDHLVKKALIGDVLNVLQFEDYDKEAWDNRLKRKPTQATSRIPPSSSSNLTRTLRNTTSSSTPTTTSTISTAAAPTAEQMNMGDFEHLLPWDGPSKEALAQCAAGQSDVGVKQLAAMLRVREAAAISKNKPYVKESIAANLAAMNASSADRAFQEEEDDDDSHGRSADEDEESNST